MELIKSAVLAVKRSGNTKCAGETQEAGNQNKKADKEVKARCQNKKQNGERGLGIYHAVYESGRIGRTRKGNPKL